MTDDNMGTAEQNIEVTETSAEPTQDTKTFTQDEVDAIVKARLAKYSKKYESIDLNEYKSLKQEQETKKLEEQKARGEFETILQQQKQDFDSKLSTMKSQLEREKVDGALLKAAGARTAVNPEQVAQLLRGRVTLNDEGEVHVLSEKGEVMYDTNSATPLSVDSLVNGFLDKNPHFLRAGPTGAGSTGSVGEESSNEVDLQKLDLSDPAQRKLYAEMRNKR